LFILAIVSCDLREPSFVRNFRLIQIKVSFLI
jgi:hypothetical protein